MSKDASESPTRRDARDRLRQWGCQMVPNSPKLMHGKIRAKCKIMGKSRGRRDERVALQVCSFLSSVRADLLCV